MTTLTQKGNDRKCCGLCSSRTGARIVIWLTMIRLLYEIYFVLSDGMGKFTIEQYVIFAVITTLGFILTIVGILGEIKENLVYIQFFYIFQFYKIVILILRLFTWPDSNNQGLNLFQTILTLGIEIYFAYVISSYFKVLKAATEEASTENHV